MFQAVSDVNRLNLIRNSCKGGKQPEEAIADGDLQHKLRDQSRHASTLTTRHADQNIEAKAKPTSVLTKKTPVWRKAAQCGIYHVGGAPFCGTTRKHRFLLFYQSIMLLFRKKPRLSS
jgi:hypothetical protein